MAVLLTLAGAGGIYATRWATSSGARATTGASEAAVQGPRVRWPAGSELRYRVSRRTQSVLHLATGPDGEGGADAGGESTLEGTLVLKVARTSGDRATLLASRAREEVQPRGSRGARRGLRRDRIVRAR